MLIPLRSLVREPSKAAPTNEVQISFRDYSNITARFTTKIDLLCRACLLFLGQSINAASDCVILKQTRNRRCTEGHKLWGKEQSRVLWSCFDLKVASCRIVRGMWA